MSRLDFSRIEDRVVGIWLCDEPQSNFTPVGRIDMAADYEAEDDEDSGLTYCDGEPETRESWKTERNAPAFTSGEIVSAEYFGVPILMSIQTQTFGEYLDLFCESEYSTYQGLVTLIAERLLGLQLFLEEGTEAFPEREETMFEINSHQNAIHLLKTHYINNSPTDVTKSI